MKRAALTCLNLLSMGVIAAHCAAQPGLSEFPLPPFSHPHDVAPAPDGSVWYTAQLAGVLGRLDPATGKATTIRLGPGSRPHGVIIGPDGAPWVTDEGLNAIVRVDPATARVVRFPLPDRAAGADLNTAVFDSRGILWFTGQKGWYGRLDPRSGQLDAWPSPRGPGPYGIAVSPRGVVYYVSLAASYLGRIASADAGVTALDPPIPHAGTRRVWFDSKGTAWISGWNSGMLLSYSEGTGAWENIAVPGSRPSPYAVYVDANDTVWISDFGGNAIHRYDPAVRTFSTFPIPSRGAEVRQMAGRKGEVWAAESGANRLLRITE